MDSQLGAPQLRVVVLMVVGVGAVVAVSMAVFRGGRIGIEFEPRCGVCVDRTWGKEGWVGGGRLMSKRSLRFDHRAAAR